MKKTRIIPAPPFVQTPQGSALPVCSAVEGMAMDMADAARMREVGRLCLRAALTRLSDDVAEVCDLHAAAISNAPPAVAAEILRLKSAAAEALRRLAAEAAP